MMSSTRSIAVQSLHWLSEANAHVYEFKFINTYLKKYVKKRKYEKAMRTELAVGG